MKSNIPRKTALSAEVRFVCGAFLTVGMVVAFVLTLHFS